MKFQKVQNYFILFYLLLSLLYSNFSFSCPKAFSGINRPTPSNKKHRTPPNTKYPTLPYIKYPTSSNTKDFTLTEAKKVVRALNIRSLRELKEKRKTNGILTRIPLNLDVAYRDQGWTGFTDFFGTTREWYLYRKLKAYFEELDLQNTVFHDSFSSEYFPPLSSESLALNYWVTIDHVFQYLVNNKVATWQHFIYEDSQVIVQKLNIRTQDDLRKKRKEVRSKLKEKQPISEEELHLISYVPAEPRKFYKDPGWNREAFFAKEWLPVGEAQALVQELGITSVFELWNRRKTDARLQNIPSHPGQIYGVDYLTFFGLKGVSPSSEQIRKTAEENKPFLRFVYGMTGMFPWSSPLSPELRQAVADAHLQKLAIENAF